MTTVASILASHFLWKLPNLSLDRTLSYRPFSMPLFSCGHEYPSRGASPRVDTPELKKKHRLEGKEIKAAHFPGSIHQ